MAGTELVSRNENANQPPGSPQPEPASPWTPHRAVLPLHPKTCSEIPTPELQIPTPAAAHRLTRSSLAPPCASCSSRGSPGPPPAGPGTVGEQHGPEAHLVDGDGGVHHHAPDDLGFVGNLRLPILRLRHRRGLRDLCGRDATALGYLQGKSEAEGHGAAPGTTTSHHPPRLTPAMAL